MIEQALDYEGLKHYDTKSKEYIEAKVSNFQIEIDEKAPKENPTFTGTPNAPTADIGTNTTQIATTAFVQAEIANLVGTAPDTLNTLEELAEAIEEHQEVTDLLTESIGKKANASDLETHMSTHAPTDAEKNIIVGVKKNGEILEIDSDRMVDITIDASDLGEAVTDEINNINAKIEELEQSIIDVDAINEASGSPILLTDSADGNLADIKLYGRSTQNGTPTPDSPVDIVSVADSGWFDGELLQGAYNTSTSVFSSSSDFICSKNMIPCKANDTITLRYDGVATATHILYYDKNKTFLSYVSVTTSNAPSNACYFNFNIGNSSGITPQTAKPICVTINDTYALTVKSIGKNLMPVTTVEGTTHQAVDISLPAGEYTISAYVTSNDTDATTNCLALYEYEDGTFNAGVWLTRNTRSSSSFILDKKAKKIILYASINYAPSEGDTFKWKDIQIEIGNVATEFEPYKEEIITVPVDQPLRSIENVRDELTCIDGKYGIIRRIGSKVLNGSETWNKFAIGCGISLSGAKSYSGICSHYVNGNAHGWSELQNNHFAIIENALRIKDDTNQTDLTTWKTWLQSNPVTVYYQLAQEVFEPFNEQEMFDNITTYNSTTTLFATDNADMKVEYYSNSSIGQRLAITNEEMRAEHSALYNTIKTTVGYTKKNLLKNNLSTQTKEGLTLTVDTNKSISVTGTSSSSGLNINVGSYTVKESGDYIFSGGVDSTGIYVLCYKNSTFTALQTSGELIKNAEKGDILYYNIYVQPNQTVSRVFFPMIRKAEITDNTYEPYVEDVDTRFNELQTTLSNMGAVYKQTVDLSDTSTYSEDTWYPCVGTSISAVDGFQRIKVAVALNSGTKPSWSTHQNGFTCNMDLLVKASGWGTTNSESICLDYSCVFTANNVNPCGYYQIPSTSQPVLWLRGGGKYFVTTDYDCSWTPKTASFTTNGLTLTPATTERDVYFLTKSTIHANLNANKVDIASSNYESFSIKRNGTTTGSAGILFKNDSGNLGSICMNKVDDGLYRYNASQTTAWKFLDTSNYTSYTVGKSAWTATTKGLTWSRICYIGGSLNATTGFSGLLNVRATRGSMVANATFLINASHAGSNYCNIAQLNANTYSSFRIRAVSATSGTSYIELYDEAASIASGTTQQWFCSWIPLCESTCQIYTDFADGTTVPSGYTAQTALTVQVGRVIQTSALYASEGVVLDNNKAYIAKNTSGSRVSLASMNSSNQIILGDTSYQTYLNGSTIFFGGSVVMPNNSGFHCKTTTGANINTLYMNASNQLVLGNTSYPVHILGSSVSISGLTATMTELNYCKGVTSAIQTQLDGKAPTGHTHTGYELTPSAFATPAYLVSMGSSGHTGGLGYTTIAQLKTTLGLGSAAYTNSTAYAPTTHSHTSLALNNNSALTCKNTSGTAINSLYMNTSNQLCIGAGASRIHYGTHGTTTRMQLFASNRIDLCINCNGTSDTVSAVSMIYETVYDHSAGANSTSGTVLRATSTANYACLGSSQYPFYSIYYQYMTKSSDRNVKSDINNLSDKYIDLWDKLEPKSYHYINNEHSYSLGLIAQDVESAAQEVGLSLSDCGFISKAPLIYDSDSDESQVQTLDENSEPQYRYGLDYTFVSILNLAKLKETASKVSELEATVAELLEKISQLENA